MSNLWWIPIVLCGGSILRIAWLFLYDDGGGPSRVKAQAFLILLFYALIVFVIGLVSAAGVAIYLEYYAAVAIFALAAIGLSSLLCRFL